MRCSEPVPVRPLTGELVRALKGLAPLAWETTRKSEHLSPTDASAAATPGAWEPIRRERVDPMALVTADDALRPRLARPARRDIPSPRNDFRAVFPGFIA
jgi:hypothetical protein